jgi:hypothetical protein
MKLSIMPPSFIDRAVWILRNTIAIRQKGLQANIPLVVSSVFKLNFGLIEWIIGKMNLIGELWLTGVEFKNPRGWLGIGIDNSFIRVKVLIFCELAMTFDSTVVKLSLVNKLVFDVIEDSHPMGN